MSILTLMNYEHKKKKLNKKEILHTHTNPTVSPRRKLPFTRLLLLRYLINVSVRAFKA